MTVDADYAMFGLFAAGAVLLLVAGGLLFTGNWSLVGYAVPAALAGLAAVFLGGGPRNGSGHTPERSPGTVHRDPSSFGGGSTRFAALIRRGHELRGE